MKIMSMAGAAAALVLLGGCERGDEASNPSAEAEATNATAEGKAEEGRFVLKAPGIDLAVNIPEAVRDRAIIDDESRILPPGASLAGLHVQGNSDGEGKGGDGSAELRFSAPQAPGEVAAWYRDPARGQELSIDSAGREGDQLVLSGRTREGGTGFRVRLRPRAG